jgi:hypothetical protein
MTVRRIQMRRGTATEWAAANPVLADGEIGIERDTLRCKIGNGAATWNTLGYATVRADGGDTITARAADIIPLVVKGAALQTARLLEAHASDGNIRFAVTRHGDVFTPATIRAGSTPNDGTISGLLTPPSVTGRGLVVRGNASQTGNLAEFQNSAGTMLAGANASGEIFGTDAGLGLTRRLLFGAVDSAGAGFRTVRVAN